MDLLLIGAGPTGLAVGKALREAGIGVVQVEATDHVGGNWAHGVYTTAHIISSKRTTELPDFPMPDDYPDFPSAQQMRVYFERYAERFGLSEQIRFRTRVERVEPVGDGGRDGWDVWFEGRSKAERFRGVIVCNGHHWAKSWPGWARELAERGSRFLRHSKDFKHPDELRDRRVLVVGGGNSGVDLASEAARVAARADWSLRRGYWFMPKSVFGLPSIELVRGWLPVGAQRLIMKSLIKVVVGSYERYGLPKPDHDLFEAHPTVSTEVFHYLKHGRIGVRPDVQEVEERADGVGVRFADGREAVYDLIVCATGYDVSFPFLSEGMVPVRGKVAELWAGMLRPEWRHLWVVGTSQPRYGIGPLLRPLGQLIAQWVPVQDELEVPLGAVLREMGLKPMQTHLVDPHAALRMLGIARRLTPIIAWRGRRMRGPAAVGAEEQRVGGAPNQAGMVG
jgi:hypothetical protein